MLPLLPRTRNHIHFCADFGEQVTAKTGYWTKYTYNASGNLLTVTQNAQAASASQQTRSYFFDAMSRLTAEINPETGELLYIYDTDPTCGAFAGDRVKRVDATGNTTCYAYDKLHRVISQTYTAGPNAVNTPNKFFVYDSATVNGVPMANTKGQLAEAYTTAPGSPSTAAKITDLGLSYSARGEQTDVYESTPHSGGYYHVNAAYWESGALKQIGSLLGLPTISYQPDGQGRPNAVNASSGQNPVTGTVYNSLGTPPQLTVNFGSGDSDVFTQDANTGRLTQYKFNVGAQSVTGNLTWNANGSLRQHVITDGFNSANTQTCTYGYDDISRLTSSNCGSAAAQTFAFDPFGNINKSGSPNSFQPTYTTNPPTNRIASLPGFTPTYDGNGNVLNDSLHQYLPDAENLPVTVDSVGLTYDALGRVVEQNRSGVFTQIVYGPAGGKLALMNAQTLQKAFVALPGADAAVYTASGLSYYAHTDHLSSVRLGSTSTRTVSFDVAYAPFGETYAQSGTVDASFTGQRSDTVAGSYDFHFRQYSTQGRWVSPDPAGLAAVSPSNPQSWNRYAYVTNSPLEFVDRLAYTRAKSTESLPSV